MRLSILFPLVVSLAIGLAGTARAAACGEVVTIDTHSRSQTPYALAYPTDRVGLRAVLVLLAGGDGRLKLDGNGCPQALKGNSLVRSVALFHAAGFATALVDAPSDYRGDDGLAGFRSDEVHAQDLGKVIADLRARTRLPVWVVGTSRGSISAANAAARLSGASGPDGLVLTSALMSGSNGKKPWVAQTVFDLPLEAVKVPVLIVGHAQDTCLRSPPGEMNLLAQRFSGVRLQVVTITGPGQPGLTSIAACEGRSPHGYLGQEAEVADAIARFIGAN